MNTVNKDNARKEFLKVIANSGKIIALLEQIKVLSEKGKGFIPQVILTEEEIEYLEGKGFSIENKKQFIIDDGLSDMIQARISWLK